MEMTAKEIERFLKKIDVSEDRAGCWNWTAATDAGGYGKFSRERNGGPQRKISAHRFSYELFVGPIPVGLELDHLCHTNDAACSGRDGCPHRLCVNPSHLEPVTQIENWRRGRSPCALLTNGGRDLPGRCAKGHPFDDGNTYIRADGRRRCRTCHRNGNRRRRARSSTPVAA